MPGTTKYQYMSKRTTASQEGYVVQYKGSTCGGFHKTLKAACKALMARLGVRQASQLPLRSERGAWKYKRQANTPGVLLHRARRLIQYAAARQDRDPKVEASAADLLASRDHVTLSKAMYESEEALHFVSLHLKYKPSKAHLRQAWRSVPRPESSGLGTRAQYVRQVLIKCARLMAKSPFPKAWSQNCNRFRHREQGPIMTLRSLHIIRKPRRAEKKTKSNALMFFGEGHEDDLDLGWVLMEASTEPRETLTKFVKGVDIVVKAAGAPPRTCSEWGSKMRAVKVALGRFAPPRLTGNYLRPWSTRGYMLDIMLKSLVPRLQVDPEFPMHAFLHDMNPDQHGVLQRIYMRFLKRGDDVASVQEFIRYFSVRPVRMEFLPMYCCFAEDKGFRDEDFDEFNLEAWLTAAEELIAESGLEPHPVLVAQRVRAQQSSESSSTE